jgi:hypothetical protein
MPSFTKALTQLFQERQWILVVDETHALAGT